jgi:cytochrome c oxidase subunit 2
LKRLLGTALLSPLALIVGGCGGNEDTLNAHSGAESSIVHLWWIMFGAACVGFGVVVFLLFLGWTRRNREAISEDGTERKATALVVVLGIVIPVAVLSLLFVWSDIFVLRSTAAPSPGSTALSIDVIGHQWWWEVRYPGTDAVTANEIHIPTNTRIRVVGTTADVIHSFWVPELNRKIDLIPGRTNTVLLDATTSGVFRGQCSEFCGLQHAHMTVEVVAETPAAFHKWLANMAKPARAPTTVTEQRGRALFLDDSCASCHQLRGTPARGDVGPDLTHLATRTTLAALTIPNQPSSLRAWIKDPQHFKPGSKMPAVPLDNVQLTELTAYLDSLH